MTDYIISRIEAARSAWLGWSWTHSFGAASPGCPGCRRLSRCGSQIVVEPCDVDDEPVCQHHADALALAREYDDEVAAAAELAAGYAADAITAIRRGNWDDASRYLSRAAAIEREYGDAPVYGAIAEEVERQAAAMA